MDIDVTIVGAGAAGLWAAASAARAGLRVLVLEKTTRAGTKVLASGGSRCNLTTTLGPKEAARLFGAAEKFVTPALRATPPAAVVARFHALGVPTVTEPELEKVFPASQKAKDVRDALLNDALSAGARLRYGAAVRSVAPVDGGWAVDVGEIVQSRTLLLCPGGQSYPRTGTTGDGYAWLRALRLTVVPPVPALVPLTSDAGWVSDLMGISLQHTEVRLIDPTGRLVARRARPFVFTHRGLSGPGAMDVSVHVARARFRGPVTGWEVALDLLPDVEIEALRAQLLDAAGRPGGPHLSRILGPGVPERLREAACRQAELVDTNPPLHRVDRRRRNLLVDALKGLRVPVSGTLSWDAAEVTAGGLHLDELEPRTLAVHRHPGLYVAGELLDLTGPIGGLNFQAAFATAELAVRDIARTLGGRQAPHAPLA